MRNRSLTIWLIVVFQILVCCSFIGCAESTDRNPTAVPNDEVLIIYANETALTKKQVGDWDTISAWLLTSSKEETREIVDQLATDRVDFAAAIDVEIEQIQGKLPGIRRGLHVVVFTNRSVRDGKFFVGHSGTNQWETNSVIPPNSREPHLVEQPQSNPDMLRRCLRAVAEKFDPGESSFILYTKSHGNDVMALTPRLVVRPDETDCHELVSAIDGTLPDDHMPSWYGRRIGISKSVYFDIICEAGNESGMNFSRVFMESCHSSMNEPQRQQQIPENVGKVFVTLNQQTEYSNFDPEHLLEQYDEGMSLAEVLDHEIGIKFAIAEWRGVRLSMIAVSLAPTMLLLLLLLAQACRKMKS